MQKDLVVGVGTGYKISHGEETDELCIVTMVAAKVPKSGLTAESMVPPEIDGVRTDIIEIGDLWAFQTPRSRFRPAPAGVSVSHYQSPAGTFGCVVRDRQFGTRLILSNNHVLARNNEGKLGDPILQPSPTDGGQENQTSSPISFASTPCSLQVTKNKSTKTAKGFIGFGNFLSRLFGSQINFSAAKRNPSKSIMSTPHWPVQQMTAPSWMRSRKLAKSARRSLPV